jgi:putative methyltransferase (TIGR04325 family)
MRTKDILRQLTPPAVWSLAARVRSGAVQRMPQFEGPFDSWEVAKARADGWDAQVITDKTVAAARRVRDGLAAVEQDGVERTNIPYSSTILSFIALVLAKHRAIELIDFGGGLGSNYFQNRKIVRATGLPVRWNVVERAALAEIGAREFQTDELRFFPSLAEISPKCDSVVFTGSFQCLATPDPVLDGFAAETRILAFDRLIVSPEAIDRIYVQHPDPVMFYRATYPTWCFSKAGFIDRLAKRGFTLVEDFPTNPTAPFDVCGFVFLRT